MARPYIRLNIILWKFVFFFLLQRKEKRIDKKKKT